jgi:hypothetical protein
MFARAPLSLSPAPSPHSNFITASFALRSQSPLFLFNNFRTLSFFISLLSPASSIVSALLFKKPGGGYPWSNQSLSAASLPSLFHHPALSEARFLRPACFIGAEGSRSRKSFPCVSYAKQGGGACLVLPIPAMDIRIAPLLFGSRNTGHGPRPHFQSPTCPERSRRVTLHPSLATCRQPLIDSRLRIGAWPGEISENA